MIRSDTLSKWLRFFVVVAGVRLRVRLVAWSVFCCRLHVCYLFADNRLSAHGKFHHDVLWFVWYVFGFVLGFSFIQLVDFTISFRWLSTSRETLYCKWAARRLALWYLSFVSILGRLRLFSPLTTLITFSLRTNRRVCIVVPSKNHFQIRSIEFDNNYILRM